jgi:hypothetical protein
MHPADFATVAAHADLVALQAIEGALVRFGHEVSPRHADGLDENALMLRAVIASATCSDDDDAWPTAAQAAAA